MSGYKLQNGNDISTIFASGSSSGVITGYQLSNGNDIATMFASGTSNIITGYQLPNGNDISTIFKAIIPRSINGLSLWMDANDSSTITILSGTSVSRWVDKANNYAFDASLNKYPTISTLNSKNVMAFASASNQYQYFLGDVNAKKNVVGTNSYALFIVAKYPSTTGTGGLYNKSIYAGGNGRIIMTKDNGTANSIAIMFTHTTTLDYTTSPTSLASYNIICLIVNRKTLNPATNNYHDYSYINGSRVLTNAYVAQDNNSYDVSYNAYIGAYNNNADNSKSLPINLLTGNIAEIIAYSRDTDMEADNRQKIEGYLAWKWDISGNLPLNHPYRNNPDTPSTLNITNYNFASPDASANPYYLLLTTLTGWTMSGNVYVGYGGNNAFCNKLNAYYTQYCILQVNGASITSTSISLSAIPYNLSFWIIGRTSGEFIPTTTKLKITIGVVIVTGYSMINTDWVKVDVPFTPSAVGSYTLKFENVNTNTTGDSSFLITGIIISS